MRVAMDARAAVWYRGTGIGTYTFQVLRNILSLNNNIKPIYPTECSQFNILDEESYGRDTFFKDKFWEMIQQDSITIPDNVELLHIPHNGLGNYQTSAKRIITLHDIIPYVLPDTVGVYYHKVFLETMPSIVEEATRIITVSKHSKSDICRHFRISPEKIDVIYEAPEIIYQPLESRYARNYVAKKYGLTFPYILYLGGFSPRKNVPGLVLAYHKAFPYLSKKPKLVIVGKLARNYQEVINLIEKYDLSRDIIFTGYVPVNDLPFMYNAAEMFIYPSLYEGFGLPPLEAMACKVPTICSNNSSMPEVVGDGAHLINAEDEYSMTDAIVKITENRDYSEDLALKGFKRAQQFSWEKAAAETINSFSKALKED